MSAASPPMHRAAIRTILAGTTAVEMSAAVLAPLLPRLVEDFHLSGLQIALAMVFYNATRLVINLPMGMLTDRFRPSRVAAVGALTMALGAATCALAPSYALLLAGRVFMGVATSAYFLSAQVWLSTATGEAIRRSVFALYNIAGLSGSTLAPGFAGLLADVASWRAAFLFGAFVAGGAALSGYLISLREGGRRRGQGSSTPSGRLPWRIVLGGGIVSAAVFFFHGGILTILVPLIGAQRFGLSSSALGGLFVLLALLRALSGLVAVRISRSIGLAPVVVGGVLISGTLSGCLMLSNSPLSFVGFVSILGLGHFGSSLVSVLLIEATPEVMWGKTLAVNRQLADLGGVLGPLTVGTALDLAGENAAAATGGSIIVILGVVGAILLIPQMSRPRPQEVALAS